MKKKSAEKQITEDIFCLSGLLTAQVNERVFSEHQLTLSSYIPLQMIKQDIQTITEMRTFSSETAAGLGKKIKYLENLKLISRTLDKNDKRKWLFKLTRKGEIVCREAENSFVVLAEDFFTNFTSGDKKLFQQLINTLENNLIK